MTMDALSHPTRQAGLRAERQMAFYLRRAFASSADHAVLNNLRIETGADVAQIDHLVVSRWGLVIIESKSVATKVRVNARDEWMRLVSGSWRGMPSPILQATRQKDFLRDFLNANKTTLLGRIVLVGQKSFRNFSMDVMVAISDHGIIDRVDGADPKEVFKADQIPARIAELLETRRREIGGFLGSFRTPHVDIEEAERARLVAFLQDFERPLEEQQTDGPFTSAETWAFREPERPEVPAPLITPPLITAPLISAPLITPPLNTAPPGARHRCRHCNGNGLEIRWGKYGYYFKCLACSGNTPLPVQADGSKPTLRKDKSHFYIVMPDGSEDLFFTNPCDMAEK